MSVAARTDRIVVVGASLAGLRSAEALRHAGHSGPLTIVGDEPHRPYDRPPLSKHVITGELAADRTALPNLVALDAEWRLGRAATALDRDARDVVLAGGARIPYDRLVIATGASARPWRDRAEGALRGVFTLRSRDDADALRSALAAGPEHVLIVGGGLIGCEAASGCRELGLSVTLVDPNPAPLARILGLEVGAIIGRMLAAAGVAFRPGASVRTLEGDETGRVRRARLTDGSSIAADVVIVALGAIPNTAWLEGSGLRADARGIQCDGACRVLGPEGAPRAEIVAAGDVALWPHPLYARLVRLEHWGNAVEQAGHAARALLGEPVEAYAPMPLFWSSQFGVNIKLAGLTEGADSIAFVQGSAKERRFLAVYGRAGRTIAAVSFDCARWLPAYCDAVAAGAAFPPIREATDQGRIATRRAAFPAPRGEARLHG